MAAGAGAVSPDPRAFPPPSMELFFVLLALFLITVVFVLPVWTFITIGSLKRELRAVQERLDGLERRPVTAFRAPEAPSVASPAVPVAAAAPLPPPPAPEPVAPPSSDSPAASAFPPEPPILPPVPAEPPPVAAPEPPALPPVVPAPIAPAARAAPAPRINWELFMGVKLFAWIGGLALFLGVGFFVKYSFENDLVPPEVRIALGFLTGAALLVGGVLLVKRAPVTAQTLCATGVVSLYAVTFAAHAVYHFAFFGPWATFALMTLVTATAFLLAVRLDARVVAVLGLLGGFLTPVLLSTGRDNVAGLFGYLALLDVGLLAVALHRRWFFLVPLGAVATAVMQVGWAARFLAPEKQTAAQIVVLGFGALFVAACALAQRRDRAAPAFVFTAALLPFMAFGFGWSFLAYPELALRPAALFAFVLVADALVFSVAWLDARAARIHLAAGAMVFALLAFWTQEHLAEDTLRPALAAFLGFAALHTAAPLALLRRHPGDPRALGWPHLWPVAALALVLLGVTQLPTVSVGVWIAILLLDLLAIGVAVLAASLVGVVAALILTLASAAFWILKVPTEPSEVGGLLLVIGGFGGLFAAAGVWLWRRVSTLAEGEGAAAPPAPWQAHLPTLSVLLPFVLLILVTARLPLANPSPVFGLALALAILALGLVRILGFGALAPATLAGVAGLLFTWMAERFAGGAAVVALVWFGVFFAVFLAFPFVLRSSVAGYRGPWIAAALAGPAVFPLVYAVVNRTWPNDVMGLLPLAFAFPALAALVAVLRLLPTDHPRRLGATAWFGGVALLFLTLVFPIQFERQWLILGWALEGAALLWLFQRVPHPGLRMTGLALLLFVFGRLLLGPALEGHPIRSTTPFLNTALYTYGIVIACLFGGARLLRPPVLRAFNVPVTALLQAAGVVLLFVLLNLQVADVFTAPGDTVRFRVRGDFARDMTTTIAWAGFAFALLVVGLTRRLRAARYAALALLSVTLLKLFFHDLSQLAQLYRIGALVVVAAIAILASFIYQRFLPAASSDHESPPPPSPGPTP
jgi:uncharacterized membrane protein